MDSSCCRPRGAFRDQRQALNGVSGLNFLSPWASAWAWERKGREGRGGNDLGFRGLQVSFVFPVQTLFWCLGQCMRAAIDIDNFGAGHLAVYRPLNPYQADAGTGGRDSTAHEHRTRRLPRFLVDPRRASVRVSAGARARSGYSGGCSPCNTGRLSGRFRRVRPPDILTALRPLARHPSSLSLISPCRLPQPQTLPMGGAGPLNAHPSLL